jgi:hypothetical protein
MQIRYSTKLSLQEYIEQEAWNQAHLDHCPFHPEGGAVLPGMDSMQGNCLNIA